MSLEDRLNCRPLPADLFSSILEVQCEVSPSDGIRLRSASQFWLPIFDSKTST
jgi:hypothetical protein